MRWSSDWQKWSGSNNSNNSGTIPLLPLSPPPISPGDINPVLMQQMQRQLSAQIQVIATSQQRYQQDSRLRQDSQARMPAAEGLCPRQNTLPQRLWHSHDMRLLAPAAPMVQDDGNRHAVLIVPSLVNRAGIFDLPAAATAMPDDAGDHPIPPPKSFIKFLQAAGITPLLLDWGVPQPGQADWGLQAYVQQGLLPALAAAGQWLGRPPALLGYCMGGNLALAAAQLAPSLLSRLILLATPWNFHQGDGVRYAQQLQAIWPWLEDQLNRHGQLPVAALQIMLLARDPLAVLNKFRRASQLDGQAWQDFVAVEDWLNDGVPLTAAVARETLHGWFVRNQPAVGQWRVDGQAILAERVSHPLLLAVAARDSLVPPASALSLANHRRNAKILMANTGHLGLMASRQVIPQVWQPIVDWLRQGE